VRNLVDSHRHGFLGIFGLSRIEDNTTKGTEHGHDWSAPPEKTDGKPVIFAYWLNRVLPGHGFALNVNALGCQGLLKLGHLVDVQAHIGREAE
jgi:hypothetical protein